MRKQPLLEISAPIGRQPPKHGLRGKNGVAPRLELKRKVQRASVPNFIALTQSANYFTLASRHQKKKKLCRDFLPYLFYFVKIKTGIVRILIIFQARPFV